MVDIFKEGSPVTLLEILDNKDWRVEQQQQLMNKYPQAVVVAVKLNIPGAIKNNQLMTQIFIDGWQKLKTTFLNNEELVSQYDLDRLTGPEGFIVIDGSIDDVKRETIQFEVDYILGRLFDVDVMTHKRAAKQISRTALGLPQRVCFVCQQPAKICARMQKHSSQEIKQAINILCGDYFEGK